MNSDDSIACIIFFLDHSQQQGIVHTGGGGNNTDFVKPVLFSSSIVQLSF